VKDWRPDVEEKLSIELEAEFEVEHLALEDIFLELHR
jgi:hypothetical protein